MKILKKCLTCGAEFIASKMSNKYCCRECERDVLGFRHIGGLRDGQVVACVRVGGRPEHIHVNIVLVGEVERIVELGEVLDTGTLAAPILANRAA